MELENIKGSAAMSYQGSAAMPAVTVASPAPETEPTQNQPAQAPAYRGVSAGYPVGAEENGEPKDGKSGQLKKAVSDLNKQMSSSEAIFGIHEETNRVTIKIVDKSTKEVIKEFPPEETLDMIAKVWEVAGILVDEKL